MSDNIEELKKYLSIIFGGIRKLSDDVIIPEITAGRRFRPELHPLLPMPLNKIP